MIYTFNIKKASIYINTGQKTLSEIKKETGADVLINGGLFDTKKFIANCHLKADGYLYAQDPYTYYGFGWNNDDTALQVVTNYDNLDNYICCVTLAKGGKAHSLIYDSAVGGKRGRTAVGTMPDSRIAVFCSNDGTKDAMTPEALQQYVLDKGWKDALMLDGGGSSQCITPIGTIKSVTSTGDERIVHNVLCFWLDDTTEKEADEDMDATEKATRQMEAWASDNSHGYDQIYRWGEKGDFDCSAAVIQAWENAGVPVKSNGATYTGNMLKAFLKCGFQDITASVNKATGSGLKRGDVLLNETKHTAMYCGDGYEVEASLNEKGTATGGKPGDQTGREFLKRTYRNYPWTHILRYTGKVPDVANRIDTVKEVQTWLNNTYSSGLTLDGLYGSQTKKALTKALQKELGVTADGIFGPKTKAAVKNLKKGSKGALVKVLQGFLVCLGQKSAYVDGDFGGGTESAVKAIQKAYKLTIDGIAGKDTFTVLCR